MIQSASVLGVVPGSDPVFRAGVKSTRIPRPEFHPYAK